MATLALPQGYGYVFLSVIGLNLQCMMTGFAAGGARKKTFTKEFLKENFPAEVKEHGVVMGYPDMGSGKLSQKLDFASWYSFNNAQRTHYNYLESITAVSTLTLISGFFYPAATVALAVQYMVGRVIYSAGYLKAGPGGRLVGVITLDIALVALLCTASYGSFQLGGGISGLKALYGF